MNEKEKFRKIHFDKDSTNSEKYTLLINDIINLVFCVIDTPKNDLIKEIIESGVIFEFDILYKICDDEIKEKIDNFFRIFFFFFSESLQNKLEILDLFFQSERFFYVILQSYFPQVNNSELNQLLNKKVRFIFGELIEKENENLINFPNIYYFLKTIKDNCEIFMVKVSSWKENKIFLEEN